MAVAGFTIYLTGCQQMGVGQQPVDQPAQLQGEPAEIITTIRVSTVANSGRGSLREAIQLANDSPGVDRIIFESDDDLYKQPQTIFLASSLPVIKDNLIIDGFIENVLWKASGVTVSGSNRYRIFEVADSASLTIKHLTIADGKSTDGGGILNQGEALVKSTTLMNNSATGQGGAIYNSGKLYVINSTLANNAAGSSGAGLFNSAGRVEITNSTFAWNSAKDGGAIYNQSQIQMKNSILAGSKNATDCVSKVAFDRPGNRNMIQSQDGCGTSYSVEDPILSALNYYNGPTMTIPLAGNSPAINRGDNAAAVDIEGRSLMWDQRGNGDPRFVAGITDIGAFESQSRIRLEVDTLEDSDKRWCTKAANDCSLRGALLIASHSKRFSTITFDTATFTVPTTLTISEPLPEIIEPTTIDASAVPNISVNLSAKTDQLSVITEKLNLKNIRFSNRH